MLISTASFAAVVVALIGCLIVWSNPARGVNRIVFTCSLHLATWLTFLHITVYAHGGLFWLRLTCAVGAAVPMHFWLVKESIVSGLDAVRWRWLCRSVGWLAITLALAALCFTNYFIPLHSTDNSRLYGVLSGPSGGASFWIDALGGPHTDKVESRFQITWPDGTATAFGLNGMRRADGLELYTRAIGPSTLTAGGRELILTRAEGSPWLPLRIGRSVRGTRARNPQRR